MKLVLICHYSRRARLGEGKWSLCHSLDVQRGWFPWFVTGITSSVRMLSSASSDLVQTCQVYGLLICYYQSNIYRYKSKFYTVSVACAPFARLKIEIPRMTSGPDGTI
jgi:hypothetical protein